MTSFASLTNNLRQGTEAAKKAAKEAAKSTLEQVKSNQNVQQISQKVNKVLEGTSDFFTPLLEKVLEIPEIKDLTELNQKFTKVITILRKKEAFNQLFDDKINASYKDETRKTQLLALRNILAQNINVFTYNDYRNNRFFNYEYILLILKNRLAVLEDIQGSIQGDEEKLDRLLKALKMDNTLKEYILGNTTTEPNLTPLDLDESFFHALNDILLNFIGGQKQNQESGEESDKKSGKQREGLQTIIKLFEEIKKTDTNAKIKTAIQNSVDELDKENAEKVMTFIKEIQTSSTNNTPGGTRRNKTNQKKRKSSKRKIHK